MKRRFRSLYPLRDTVTLLDRDSMKRERITIKDLAF